MLTLKRRSKPTSTPSPEPTRQIIDIAERVRVVYESAADYPMAEQSVRGLDRLQVRKFVEANVAGSDEGTGAQLDALIDSWVRQQLALLEHQHATRVEQITVYLKAARDAITRAEVEHHDAQLRLRDALAVRDHARRRLAGTHRNTGIDTSSHAPTVTDSAAGQREPGAAR